MKINSKFLSIPPHISTRWGDVKGLYMKGALLVINLLQGESVQISGLSVEVLQTIFQAHAAYLELEEACAEKESAQPLKEKDPFPFLLSEKQMANFLHLGVTSLDGLTSAMQHNSEQANAPDLPKEILEKIGAIVQIISPEEGLSISPPEPHCNCPHCQISRAIYMEDGKEVISQEPVVEDICDGDLNFEQWEISQKGKNIFTVANKLDAAETYQVFLGEPIGCTCGHSGCEHILAVLKS